jgi:hypothetical protein
MADTCARAVFHLCPGRGTPAGGGPQSTGTAARQSFVRGALRAIPPYIVLRLAGQASCLKNGGSGRRFPAPARLRYYLDPVVKPPSKSQATRYYQDPSATRIRIGLVAGRYSPQFHFPTPPLARMPRQPRRIRSCAGALRRPRSSQGRASHIPAITLSGYSLSLVAVLSSLFVISRRPDPIDVFWRPLEFRFPVTLAIGTR